MAILDDIAQKIVDLIGARVTFHDQAQEDSTKASMRDIAKGILGENRYFDIFEAYMTGSGVTVGTSDTAVEFNNVRQNGDSYTLASQTEIQIDIDGAYIIEYSVGFEGGEVTRELEAKLHENGSLVPGSKSAVIWDSPSTGGEISTSGRAVLDLVDGDIITLQAKRIGAGTGAPVTTLADATTISLTRASF